MEKQARLRRAHGFLFFEQTFPAQKAICTPRELDAEPGLDWWIRTQEWISNTLDFHALGTREVRRTLSRAEEYAAHRFLVGPMGYLLLSFVACICAILMAVYVPSYVVYADGVRLGTVSSREVFLEAREQVEARASVILGHEYILGQEISFERALTERDKLTPLAGFESYLLDSIGEVMKGHVLTVNGAVIGAMAERAEIDALLEEIKAVYVTDATTSAEFLEPVRISYEYTSADMTQDAPAIRQALLQNRNGQTGYDVRRGDTFSGIAHQNNMSVSELSALNPNISIDRLSVGQTLQVREVIPFLSVRTVDRLSYNESIPCPIQEVEDDKLYEGERKVRTNGIEGAALVEAEIIRINGAEKEREIISSKVLSEPTAQVVAVGTKPRPKTMPTGTFQWPTSGQITSRFGTRFAFGTYSFHSGLDIANAYGTAIRASDGGTVTFAAYQGTYGNVIRIRHNSGVETIYAHCSDMLVTPGTKVYQGQLIGRTGQTGRSTGNHLHFEIRIGGTAVNPLSYLP